MSNQTCVYASIINATDKCAFTRAFCAEDVPLADFYFCSEYVQGNFWSFAPILSFGLFLCFLLLGSTADDYLTPALERIATKFNFSETLSGVTLLAFANGAPDVMSSIAASSTNSEGIFLSMGAIFGAGLFVTTFVFAKIISICPDLKVRARETGRDLCFFLTAIILLFLYAIVFKRINTLAAGAFICLYFLFIIVVLHGEHSKSRRNNSDYKAYRDSSPVKVGKDKGLELSRMNTQNTSRENSMATYQL